MRSTALKRQPINILCIPKRKKNHLTFLKNISGDWLNDWKDSGILGLEMEKPTAFCAVKFFGFIIIRKNVVANVAKWLAENVARNIHCRHIHLKVGLPPVIRFVILHFLKKPEMSWKKRIIHIKSKNHLLTFSNRAISIYNKQHRSRKTSLTSSSALSSSMTSIFTSALMGNSVNAGGDGGGGETLTVWLCKICAEQREIWKKSGAWFFKVRLFFF